VPTDWHEASPTSGQANPGFAGDDITRWEEADMLDETRSSGYAGSPPLPATTAASAPHCCNRLHPLSPALPLPTNEGIAMNERERELRERLIKDPDWARETLDPEARIGNEEWGAWETRADQERQRRGWE
jgi:hypothetical protein